MHAPVGLAKCSGIQTITIGLISIVSVFLEHPVQSISKKLYPLSFQFKLSASYS